MQATMASKRFRRPVPSFALLARAGPTSRGLINRVAGSVAALRTEPASPRRGPRPTAHAAPRSPLFSRPARSLRSPIIAPPRRWRRHHGLRHRGVRAQANQSSTPPALAPRPLVKPPTQASEMKGPRPPQKTGPCPPSRLHASIRTPFRPPGTLSAAARTRAAPKRGATTPVPANTLATSPRGATNDANTSSRENRARRPLSHLDADADPPPPTPRPQIASASPVPAAAYAVAYADDTAILAVSVPAAIAAVALLRRRRMRDPVGA